MRDCECGRVHFDTSLHGGDYEPGELDGLLRKQEEKPDKYVSDNSSVTGIEINGKFFADGCPCDGAVAYEGFLKDHAALIAEYLNGRAKELREAADRMEVTS